MKKKLISILTCLTIFVGLGTTAFAEGISHKTEPTKASMSVSESKTKPIKVSNNYKYIKSELLNGATVSTIKSNLDANFKANLEKHESKAKFDKNANDLLERYNEHLKDAEIIDDVVSNPAIKKSLKDGKTLNQAKNALLSQETVKINKLVSEKKITQEEGTKRIANLKEKLSKNEGIFLNEGLIHKIRVDINKGESISQIKQDIINTRTAKVNEKVKAGKLPSEKATKIDAHIKKEVDNMPEFKHLSKNHLVQEALNKGESATQIKSELNTKINSLISKVSSNDKLSSAKKTKRIDHLKKVDEKIQSKGIFSVEHL